MEHVYMFLYFMGIILALMIRLPHRRQYRAKQRISQQASGTEALLLLLEPLTIFVLPLIWGLTPWLDFADYNWPIAAINPAGNLGLVFMALAIGLMWRAHQDLGNNWSPTLELLQGHRLVAEGIYSLIRHPLYAALLPWSIAQMLMVHNWIAGPSSLLTFVLICFLRIPAEEKMMLEHFGDEYRAYCQRTGRLIPRLRQPSHP